MASSGFTSIPHPPNATVSSIVQSDTVGTFISSNLARKGAIVYNRSSVFLYVKLGAGASAADHSVEIPPRGTFFLPFPAYTGDITGVWTDSGAGTAQVTEMF